MVEVIYMAKKKKKRFQKSSLLSLFQSGNYLKVISKIKQFEIEGMQEDELREIKIASYRSLSESNFEIGDIARALRDVESLLSIDDDPTFKLTKLKYLCYIEYFEDAVTYAEELLGSKHSKIKKEAIFFYLLAKIYGGEAEVDKKLIRQLTPTRQNYILGFASLCEGETDRALEYLNLCRPRAKIEKNNIEAIKAIISNKRISCSDDIKPLYRFLLSGDDHSLQNTKNARAMKKALAGTFAREKQNEAMQALLSAKHSIDVQSIIKNISDKEQQTKLIYNNIVLMMEEGNKLSKALQLFLKYQDRLAIFVESAKLLMQIASQYNDKMEGRRIEVFFGRYLELHIEKLSRFQIDLIFLFLINHIDTKKVSMLAEKYHRGDILFFVRDLPRLEHWNSRSQEKFNGLMKDCTSFVQASLNTISKALEQTEETASLLRANELKGLARHLKTIYTLFEKLENPSKKCRKTIFGLLSNGAFICQSFDLEKHRDLYGQLSKTIEKHIDYFGVKSTELSVDIKALFFSIEKDQKVKSEEKIDEDDFFLQAHRAILGLADDRSDRYNFNEVEYDLLIIKRAFMKALENGDENPFGILSELYAYRYDDFTFSYMMELISAAKVLDRYDEHFIGKLLKSTHITFDNSILRDRIVVKVKDYARIDSDAAMQFLDYILMTISQKQRETAWYLKWIACYLDLVQTYELPRDNKFNRYIEYFLDIQEKKKYKSLKALEKRIKGYIYNGGGLFD